MLHRLAEPQVDAEGESRHELGQANRRLLRARAGNGPVDDVSHLAIPPAGATSAPYAQAGGGSTGETFDRVPREPPRQRELRSDQVIGAAAAGARCVAT